MIVGGPMQMKLVTDVVSQLLSVAYFTAMVRWFLGGGGGGGVCVDGTNPDTDPGSIQTQIHRSKLDL